MPPVAKPQVQADTVSWGLPLPGRWVSKTREPGQTACPRPALCRKLDVPKVMECWRGQGQGTREAAGTSGQISDILAEKQQSRRRPNPLLGERGWGGSEGGQGGPLQGIEPGHARGPWRGRGGLRGVRRQPGLHHCEEGRRSPWEGGGCERTSWEFLKSLSPCESAVTTRQGGGTQRSRKWRCREVSTPPLPLCAAAVVYLPPKK